MVKSQALSHRRRAERRARSCTEVSPAALRDAKGPGVSFAGNNLCRWRWPASSSARAVRHLSCIPFAFTRHLLHRARLPLRCWQETWPHFSSFQLSDPVQLHLRGGVWKPETSPHAGGTSVARGSSSACPFRLRFDFLLPYVQKDKSLSVLLSCGCPFPSAMQRKLGRKGRHVFSRNLPS